MAANPIVTQKALEILGVDWGFGRWLLAACVPSILAALVLPWTMRLVSPSTVDVAAVRAVIDADLSAYVLSPPPPPAASAPLANVGPRRNAERSRVRLQHGAHDATRMDARWDLVLLPDLVDDVAVVAL